MRPVFIMASTRFYLDERNSKTNKPCVLKVADLAHELAGRIVTLDAVLHVAAGGPVVGIDAGPLAQVELVDVGLNKLGCVSAEFKRA